MIMRKKTRKSYQRLDDIQLEKIAMSPLDQIVFIADYIEPNRKIIPGLIKVRKLAFEKIWMHVHMRFLTIRLII